ncbi:hypothetical protein E5676_scaffold218G00010 [Cucumis melo var. makuwa]|uniref:Uncharacterized protein n=2 Tax=Cucumis melo TaxID=3656 RepID=A0A5A7VAF3_CUCMM|nr:hypothetical protein E6C27_scaffold548G001610 [Cucumis melo var. makuwa]TYK02814.1 hypothetical protein E5676_scaffold218G00010 [Cucumis melo var. makuwa]
MTLSHIQARRFHRRYLICKFKSIVFFKKKKNIVASSTLSLKTLGFIDTDAASPPLQNVDAVAVKKIAISNILQSRRSSSQICYSREDVHLQYVAIEKIFISNIIQSEGRHLQYVVVEKFIISIGYIKRIIIHRGDHSSPMCYSSEHYDDSTSQPPTLQMMMVQLQENDDGTALPPPLKDDNDDAVYFHLSKDDDDEATLPSPL